MSHRTRFLALSLVVSILGCAHDPSAAEGIGGETADGGEGEGGDGNGGDPREGGGPTTGGGAPIGGSGGGVPAVGFPDPDWQSGDPADHGIDPAALDAAAAAAEAHGSHCLVVVKDGVIVREQYWQGKNASSRDKSFSVAKSYTSALVGIAIGRGDIESLDQSAADFIPSWQGTEHEAITIRHLVTMTSGLEWSVFSDYVSMATFSSNHTEYALELGQEEAPGASWVYHNGGVQILEAVFEGATGMSIEAYAIEHLWSRIGSGATWNHDPSENPTTYAHVLATCRDHARFGWLYARGGAWSDGQVIPEDYFAASLAPSQEQNRAYGYLFWLNGQMPRLDPFNQQKDEMLAPWAPTDLFAARGFGDQFIDVVPSLGLVVVRIGPDPTGSFFNPDEMMEQEDSGTHEAIVRPIIEGIGG